VVRVGRSPAIPIYSRARPRRGGKCTTLTTQPTPIPLVPNPDELLAVLAPYSKPRVRLRIRLPDRKLGADTAAKSVAQDAGGDPRGRRR